MNICIKVMAIAALMLSQNATAMPINGSFESPDLGNTPKFSLLNPVSVPGWSTTDNAIEIWANRFLGVPSYEGTQHAEINANNTGILFQDIAGIAAGSSIGFEFAHRARVGTDIMEFSITDPRPDGSLGGGNDTRLFKDKFTADTSAWVFNSGLALTALGNTVRFAYKAVPTGSGNGSVGYFLDAANFRIGGDTGKITSHPSSLYLESVYSDWVLHVADCKIKQKPNLSTIKAISFEVAFLLASKLSDGYNWSTRQFVVKTKDMIGPTRISFIKW